MSGGITQVPPTPPSSKRDPCLPPWTDSGSSPAKAAGLKTGDTASASTEPPVSTWAQVTAKIRAHTAGPMTLVDRAGPAGQPTATLATRNHLTSVATANWCSATASRHRDGELPRVWCPASLAPPARHCGCRAWSGLACPAPPPSSPGSRRRWSVRSPQAVFLVAPSVTPERALPSVVGAAGSVGEIGSVMALGDSGSRVRRDDGHLRHVSSRCSTWLPCVLTSSAAPASTVAVKVVRRGMGGGHGEVPRGSLGRPTRVRSDVAASAAAPHAPSRVLFCVDARRCSAAADIV